MNKNGVKLVGACVCLLLLGACSHSRDNLEQNMEVLIDNMRSHSYDFNGKLHAEVGGDVLEEMLVLDGSYVPNEGYTLQADVNLPGFETKSDILSKDDQLYYKLPRSNKWEPTTNQDLRMLGITYKDSPADLFDGMRDMVLLVEPTDRNNVFQVTLDRGDYEEKADQDGIMRLPQVDLQSHDIELKLLENPVVDVEVDLDENVIRSLTLHYVIYSSFDGKSPQTMIVTYEMEMAHFNENQALPEL